MVEAAAWVILVAAIAVTVWVIARARRVGTGVMLAATAGVTLLWLVGLVNLFALASR
jgi:hypothetical protein